MDIIIIILHSKTESHQTNLAWTDVGCEHHIFNTAIHHSIESHMPIMQLTNALSYTSNGIMKLHDTVLATGKLGVDFY
jgi:hypothetical protein